jgi:hypothetical protein
MSVILETAINEIATISGDYKTLQHPFSGIDSFSEIIQFMADYEAKYPQYKNFRFVQRYEYTKEKNSRYGVTREWYDLVADYKTELLEAID